MRDVAPLSGTVCSTTLDVTSTCESQGLSFGGVPDLPDCRPAVGEAERSEDRSTTPFHNGA